MLQYLGNFGAKLRCYKVLQDFGKSGAKLRYCSTAAVPDLVLREYNFTKNYLKWMDENADIPQ